MNTEDMSDRDDRDNIIRNQDTRTRRDWVNKAIEGVRRRLEKGEPMPEPDSAAQSPDRPQLSVVRSGRPR